MERWTLPRMAVNFFHSIKCILIQNPLDFSEKKKMLMSASWFSLFCAFLKKIKICQLLVLKKFTEVHMQETMFTSRMLEGCTSHSQQETTAWRCLAVKWKTLHIQLKTGLLWILILRVVRSKQDMFSDDPERSGSEIWWCVESIHLHFVYTLEAGLVLSIECALGMCPVHNVN